MSDYRICLFDLAGYTASVGIAARLIDARQLMALATRALPDGHWLELWSGERCLVRVGAPGGPPGDADRDWSPNERRRDAHTLA